MTSWRGVPDLGGEFEVQGVSLFPAADAPGLFIYLPPRLLVAHVEGTGLPDFSLELVRGESPFLPPKPYGVIDFRLRVEPFPDAALDELRQTRPAAAVLPPLFSSGWLRFGDLSDSADGAKQGEDRELAEPTPLASNGLDASRYLRRLSMEEATRVKSFLQQEVFKYQAVAEMVMEGLTPSLPAGLEFRPALLLSALRQQGDAGGVLQWSRLLDFWMQDAPTLPVTPLEGFETVERARLAHLLAEWTVAEYGEWLPSPALPVQPTCRLRDGAALPELARWDLRLQRVAPRLVLLTLDPLQAARELVAREGLQAVLHETVVPPLETGFVSLTVGVNLPEALQGVIMLGVNLFAPAAAPQRIQPLTASLVFADTAAYQTVNWRFSPLEEIAYQYTTFAVIRDSRGIRRVQGNPTPHNGSYLLLGVADFPLGFVPLRASELLLSQGVVAGTVSYPVAQGESAEIPFQLNAGNPAVTVVLPQERAAAALMRLEARALAGPEVLAIGEFPARGLRLDLNSLREYGPHTVQVEVAFDLDAPLVALEFLAEADADHPERSTVLAFTPEKPKGSWQYFAPSPFQAGYRYRRGAGPELPPAQWSEPRPPFEALLLKASQLSPSP